MSDAAPRTVSARKKPAGFQHYHLQHRRPSVAVSGSALFPFDRNYVPSNPSAHHDRDTPAAGAGGMGPGATIFKPTVAAASTVTTKKKGVDPRFSSLYGSLNKTQFQQNYAFLDEQKEAEVNLLKDRMQFLHRVLHHVDSREARVAKQETRKKSRGEKKRGREATSKITEQERKKRYREESLDQSQHPKTELALKDPLPKDIHQLVASKKRGTDAHLLSLQEEDEDIGSSDGEATSSESVISEDLEYAEELYWDSADLRNEISMIKRKLSDENQQQKQKKKKKWEEDVRKDAHKKEAQAVKEGKKLKPHFPKRREMKEKLEEARFNQLYNEGGRRKVDKFLEKGAKRKQSHVS